MAPTYDVESLRKLLFSYIDKKCNNSSLVIKYQTKSKVKNILEKIAEYRRKTNKYCIEYNQRLNTIEKLVYSYFDSLSGVVNSNKERIENMENWKDEVVDEVVDLKESVRELEEKMNTFERMLVDMHQQQQQQKQRKLQDHTESIVLIDKVAGRKRKMNEQEQVDDHGVSAKKQKIQHETVASIIRRLYNVPTNIKYDNLKIINGNRQMINFKRYIARNYFFLSTFKFLNKKGTGTIILSHFIDEFIDILRTRVPNIYTTEKTFSFSH